MPGNVSKYGGSIRLVSLHEGRRFTTRGVDKHAQAVESMC